jgi:hypothetical protein
MFYNLAICDEKTTLQMTALQCFDAYKKEGLLWLKRKQYSSAPLAGGKVYAGRGAALIAASGTLWWRSAYPKKTAASQP